MRKLGYLLPLTVLGVATAQAQITVVADNFDRANSTTLGTADVGGSWSTNVTSLGINGNRALFDETTSSPVYGGANVASGIYTAQLNYSGLNFGTADATWGMTMEYLRGRFDDLSWGAVAPRGGMGMILAADNTDLSLANGYAVVTMRGATQGDSLALVSFSGGFTPGNWTPLIGDNGLMDGKAAATFRVEYTAATNSWELFADVANTGLGDPTLVTTSRGTIVDTTFTGNTMLTSGFSFYTSGADTNDFVFDNVSFTTAIPEPRVYAAMLGGLALLFVVRRRLRA